MLDLPARHGRKVETVPTDFLEDGLARVLTLFERVFSQGASGLSSADMLQDDAPEFEHPAPGSTFSQTQLFTPAHSSG